MDEERVRFFINSNGAGGERVKNEGSFGPTTTDPAFVSIN